MTANHPEDLVARLLGRANTRNGTLVGASDGNTHTMGYYSHHDGELDREAATLITSLVGERDALLLQAQSHAMEARGANDTIYKIYQVLSGGKGEPGNWNGAEPARAYVAAAESTIRNRDETIAALRAALENTLRRFENCARHVGNDDETIAAATASARRALASPHQEGTEPK